MKFYLHRIELILFTPVSLVLLSFFLRTPASAQTNADWYMAGANPQRTSWVSEGVTGSPHVEWYRTMDAYISPKVQVITGNGLVYVSTSRGLYAFNAADGQLAWRFDTELPLGHSPTVVNGIAYVGGFDKKLYAINAVNGSLVWSFDGAKAGYDTNPVVVDGKVILGNRDGNLYAVGAVGAPQAGQQIWRFLTGGQINYSPAYKDGVVYFASDDNYAYAVRTSDGTQVWRSNKLPGDGYHSYWPVIFRNMVVFSASIGYRTAVDPGTKTINNAVKFYDMERDSIWPNDANGTLIGNQLADEPWAQGYPLRSAARINEYHENNPAADTYQHKPWRSVMVGLNLTNGSEYTIDTDNDGYPESLPFTMWGTHSGNRYPPVVGSDNILYSGNIFMRSDIQVGRIMGWNPDSPNALKVTNLDATPMDEPISLSSGNNSLYKVYQDYKASWFGTSSQGSSGNIYDYGQLSSIAPGYDDRVVYESADKWYGVFGSSNGTYGYGGDHTALVPYQGRLFIIRATSILAFGPGTQRGRLGNIPIVSRQDNINLPAATELTSRLDTEIQKMVSAGHLRTASINNGQFNDNSFGLSLINYFENPGDTLYTLSIAYPYLSPSVQTQLRPYLQQEFSSYFNPTMYARIGWAQLAAREGNPQPQEIQTRMAQLPKQTSVAQWSWSWSYPPFNFYALWKYAQIFPADVLTSYNLAKSKLEIPVPADNSHLIEYTWELNAYLTGYKGFLNLQELAGKSGADAQLRTQVINEYNRLIQLRANNFNKDTPWPNDPHKQNFNVARNFLYLCPEVGADLRSRILPQVQTALTEYESIMPYWFASNYEAVKDEGIISPLYNVPALFQAEAMINNQSASQLYKYLDAPALVVGDLFYLQNLVALLSAMGPPPSPGPSVTTTPVPPPPTYDFADLWLRLLAFGTNDQNLNLIGTTSLIDIFDLNYLIKNL